MSKLYEDMQSKAVSFTLMGLTSLGEWLHDTATTVAEMESDLDSIYDRQKQLRETPEYQEFSRCWQEKHGVGNPYNPMMIELLADWYAMKQELDGLKMTEGDLIRRSDVLKFPIRRDHYDRENGNPHFINGIETVMEYIESLPSVETAPVVHAHWERFTHPSGTHGIRCNHCKTTNGRKSKRCPECGAHMDEEVNQ